MAVKLTHDEFVERLKSRSSEILLKEGQSYQGMNTKMVFVCVKGHGEFETYPRHILVKGSGCPLCGSSAASSKNSCSEKTFRSRMESSAQQVEYVSGYSSMTKKAIFRCRLCNHEWSTLPKTVVSGSGCPACKAAKVAATHTYTQDQFNEKLADRNKHLSPVYAVEPYRGVKHKIKFRCEFDHEWRARPGDLWNNSVGCPHCAGVVKRNAQEALKDVTDRWPNITIISEHSTLLGRREDIDVMCEAGHVWTSHYERLMAGHYCPHCYGNAKMTDSSFVSRLQKVSPTIAVVGKYENSHTSLDVRCNVCNHEWKPRPYNLLNGYGCPQCSRNNKFSKKALAWLAYIEKTEGIVIQHALSYGEYKIPGTRYRVDGFCQATNTVYEFYGDYWHGNPKVYNPNATNPHVSKTYGDLYKSTIEREQELNRRGFRVVSVWESAYDDLVATTLLARVLSSQPFIGYNVTHVTDEMVVFEHTSHKVVVVNVNRNPDTDDRYRLIRLLESCGENTYLLFSDEVEDNGDLIIRKLNHYGHTSDKTVIHARKCDIRRVSTSKERNDLLNKNHVQGGDNSQISYGAYYDGALVAVMSFSTPRTGIGVHKNKKPGTYELVRFCTDVNYRIPGIASRLLKHFQRSHEWTEIYSYADKRWSVGNMYHKLGFMLVADNPPDYFYVIDGKRKHRWNYRKDVLKNKLENYDPALTEYQNMVNHGYWRVWDCGTLKFSMKNEIKG